MELLKEAEQVYKDNFPSTTCFERALFFSWGCAIGDCTFCYMSTQPEEKKLRETKRSEASILAECLIAKKLGWEIGFFTGGIGVLSMEELTFLLKGINEITEEKVWLSIGPTSLEKLSPYIKGVVGSTETINPELHKKICPSKPLAPYEKMFVEAKRLGLMRAMTFIVGLGETRGDFKLLKEFIQKYEINKIHVYGLIPQKDTPFENAEPPTPEEHAWWIAKLRIEFPKLDIQCGIWKDRAETVSLLLKAGANSISKLSALKLFGSSTAEEIERQAELAGRTFEGTLTKLPDVDWDAEIDALSFNEELKGRIKKKVKQYLQA